MSIDYLEDLERAIDNSYEYYMCQGAQASEWTLSTSLDELRKKAQRVADSRKIQVNIYRLVNKFDALSSDSYLCVRKILDPAPKGAPRFQWIIVDTKEAAEMMRDVSQGPSPYYGASVVETFMPHEEDEAAAKAAASKKGRLA